jgi:hypothetical protein
MVLRALAACCSSVFARANASRSVVPRSTGWPRAPDFATIRAHAPVAHLDRVLGYEPRGREFESLRARQQIKALPSSEAF